MSSDATFSEPSDAQHRPSDTLRRSASDRLSRRFGTGDAEAVSTVASLTARIVGHRGYFIPTDQRADIVQDTLLDLWRRRTASCDTSDGDFLGLVKVIAHRRCIDWLRKRRHRDSLTEYPTDLPGPHATLLSKEKLGLALRVIHALHERCRRLIALHVGYGLTYGEIADASDRTEGAVRTQAYECVKAARDLLVRTERRRAAKLGHIRRSP